MDTKGIFINQGGKLGTTYPEAGMVMSEFINDFYGGRGFAKSAGAAVYTTEDKNGYFNAIFGKYITAGMFMNDNVFTAVGARPYTTEGVRIALEAASYGTATAAEAAQLGCVEGDFIGISATTARDGRIGESVKMPVTEFREPVQDITMAFNYGLYLAAVESKDDAIARQPYLDKMAKNYTDLIDKTLCKPMGSLQPMVDGQETSITGISRIISGYQEIGRNTANGAVTAEDVSPYGGHTADRGDFYAIRSAGESNLDSQYVDAKGATLSLNHLDRLYRSCMVNWADAGNPNNKVWFMSNIAQDVLSGIAAANQRYLDTVFVQRDFSGVKTIPGRDGGLTISSYKNIPIIQSGNLNFEYAKKKVSTTRMSDIYLVDLDHIWMSVLTPVQLYTADNVAVTRVLQEINVLHSRMDTRVDSFIQHGKIVNLADDTA